MEGGFDRRQETEREYMQWKVTSVYVIRVERLTKQSD
jgi:hypothetical protein